MIEEVKKFVKEKFNGKVEHFERTVYRLKELKPDCDEEMIISAFAHDIERGFNGVKLSFFKDKDLDDPAFLKKHQEG